MVIWIDFFSSLLLRICVVSFVLLIYSDSGKIGMMIFSFFFLDFLFGLPYLFSLLSRDGRRGEGRALSLCQ
jgi:hypothetical protein